MLAVRSLTKQFGGLTALQDVTFSVEPGEIKVVIGPNGAGKTTLFHLITGVLRATSGEIQVLGHDTSGWNATGIARAGVARSFQQPQIFRSLTALENVLLGSDRLGTAGLIACGLGSKRARIEAEQQVEAAAMQLEFIGLSHRAHRIASELPAGERRYIELARALAAKPKLLLLDEPAAGLDETETEHLAGLIKRVRDSGVTVMLIEHHMQFVMNVADNIVVLNFGAMLAEGTPSEIRNSRAVIDAYLGTNEDA